MAWHVPWPVRYGDLPIQEHRVTCSVEFDKLAKPILTLISKMHCQQESDQLSDVYIAGKVVKSPREVASFIYRIVYKETLVRFICFVELVRHRIRLVHVVGNGGKNAILRPLEKKFWIYDP